MKGKVNTEFSYELFENGLDFILSGLENLGKKQLDKRAYKFGILHLAAGIELIFKERLRREHWSLLFENIDKAHAAALANGDFKSVGFESLVNRLANIAKVCIAKNESQTINELRKKRNKAQHFQITDTPAAIESVTAQAVSFALDFIKKELSQPKMNKQELDTLEKIKNKLTDFKAFVDSRWNKIQSLLQKYKEDKAIVVDCVQCLQKAVIINGEHPKCLFCNSEFKPLNLASDWASQFLGRSDYDHIKDGGPSPTMICPSCEEETLVEIGKHKAQWLCFNCATSWESGDLDTCTICGNLFEMEEMTVCGNCFDKKIADPNT